MQCVKSKTRKANMHETRVTCIRFELVHADYEFILLFDIDISVFLCRCTICPQLRI